MAKTNSAEQAAHEAGMPDSKVKDAANYAEKEHTRVPTSKQVPYDSGSMTQSRPDKSKTFASKEAVSLNASQQIGGNSLPESHVHVPEHKKADGPASSPQGYSNPSGQGKVDLEDKAASSPQYQFSTNTPVRTLSVEDPDKGPTRKAADKQGAANDNKTQPNSGCGCE